jgi:hypothetical protein
LSKEKTAELAGTGFSMFYARISTIDGSTPLKSNMKYYIKVRSIRENSLTGSSDTSKFIGPVNTRTEFNQQDYDIDEQDKKEVASYADQVKRFREAIFWELGNSTGEFVIKLRRDKAENLINNSLGNSFVIDFSTIAPSGTLKYAAYIPLSTVKQLALKNKNLVFKLPGAEFTFKPGTIDPVKNPAIREITDSEDNVDTYIYIEINKLDSYSDDGPPNSVQASNVQLMSLKAVGTVLDDAYSESEIRLKLDQLIAVGIEELEETSNEDKDSTKELNDVIESIVKGFEGTLKVYVKEYMEDGDLINNTIDITAFTQPMSAKLSFSSTVKGLKTGYVYVDDMWEAKPSYVSNANNTLSFDTLKPGQFVVLSTGLGTMFNIPDGHWSSKDIDAFASKYDLKDIFQTDEATSIDSPITVRDAVLIIEKILTAKGKGSSSTSIAGKVKELGLEGTINFTTPGRNLTRQELAALVMRVYKIKSGVDPEKMKPSRIIIINDDSTINKSYYRAAEMCVDLKIMSLDDKKNFRPVETATKAQMLSAFTRLLRLLGEM